MSAQGLRIQDIDSRSRVWYDSGMDTGQRERTMNTAEMKKNPRIALKRGATDWVARGFVSRYEADRVTRFAKRVARLDGRLWWEVLNEAIEAARDERHESQRGFTE